MASLVADYSGSSEDEIESETSHRDENQGKNYLVTNDEESSLDETPNEDQTNLQSPENSVGDNSNDGNHLPNPFTPSNTNLPTPNFETKPADGSHLVFSNPFKEEQTRKEFILQQHVKMTEKPKNSMSKKQICWKFRQGKCRFSKNCKFSHDVDNHIESPLVKGSQNQSQGQGSDGQSVPQPPRQYLDDVVMHKGRQGSRAFEPDVPDEDSYMDMSKRKKRSGVADGLMPPKKAMVALNKIQAKERPWTVKR